MTAVGPAWIWFVIAVVAALAGVVVLAIDRSREGSRHRERQRWAEGHGWQHSADDPRLLDQWTEGALAHFGADGATSVVTGTVSGAAGPRTVYVFDLMAGRQRPATVVAVRCALAFPVLLELWLDSVPFQRPGMPEMLGPAGKRYAFTDDVESARSLLTTDLVDVAGELGGDVSVAWLERDWVLAAVSADAGPSRLDRLVRGVRAIADVVDPVDEPTGKHAWREPADPRPRGRDRVSGTLGVAAQERYGHPPDA